MFQFEVIKTLITLTRGAIHLQLLQKRTFARKMKITITTYICYIKFNFGANEIVPIFQLIAHTHFCII